VVAFFSLKPLTVSSNLFNISSTLCVVVKKLISIQYDNLTLKKETHSFYADLSSDHFHKEHLGS
jgi:hypothetical protein